MNGLQEGARLAVGSVPHVDAPAAVKFQCQAFPEIPAWPQLPKRTVRERITLQGLSGLPGIRFRPEGTAVLNEPPGGWEQLTLKLIADREAGKLDGAALTVDDAAGFFEFLRGGPTYFKPELLAVKGQCAGPVTLGMALRSSDGKPLLGNPIAMNALTQYLTNHALWQARALAKLGKPILMFLDEPSRGAWDPVKLGLDPKVVHGWYDLILETLQAENVVTGLHVCGKGPFGWALESCAEVLHFDGHRYLDSLLAEAGDLGKFLGQGGWISYGLVPTAMTSGLFPEAATLVDRWMGFAHALTRLGIPAETLASHSTFSTACGLGGGSLAVADEASRCLSGLASLWKITAKIGLPS